MYNTLNNKFIILFIIQIAKYYLVVSILFHTFISGVSHISCKRKITTVTVDI